jgi:hypothetical protein
MLFFMNLLVIIGISIELMSCAIIDFNAKEVWYLVFVRFLSYEHSFLITWLIIIFIREITKEIKKDKYLDDDLLFWIRESPYTIINEAPKINPVIV